METTFLLKAVGIGILVAFVCLILSRSGREDQALLVSVSGIVLVLLMLVGKISELLSSLRQLFGL